jgi:hypothetical protein
MSSLYILLTAAKGNNLSDFQEEKGIFSSPPSQLVTQRVSAVKRPEREVGESFPWKIVGDKCERNRLKGIWKVNIKMYLKIIGL